MPSPYRRRAVALGIAMALFVHAVAALPAGAQGAAATVLGAVPAAAPRPHMSASTPANTLATRATQARAMRRRWMFLGVTPEYASATGEFRENVNHGWGVGSQLLVADRTGIIALRVDAHYVNYGSERSRVCFSETVGCRVSLAVRTSNDIFTASVGPQFMAPVGLLRLYVNGGVGFAGFVTQSTLEGTANDRRPFARSTNARDMTVSLQGGAGLYIPLRRGPQPASLDLGARYMNNGRATYLTEGGIIDRPDGSIELNPRRSDTDFVLFHLGAVVGFR